MADLIKKIKIKKQDGTFTDYIPIGAEAQNIATSDGDSVQLKLNKKPYYYNSVADMKADLKLKAGDMAVTLGYYEPNDGGNGEYRIVSGTHTDDGGSYHELSNNLFAELIMTSNTNIEQFGAYGDGTHDDSNAFNNLINASHYVNFTFNKIYKITTPNNNILSNSIINGHNATIIDDRTISDVIFHLNPQGANNIIIENVHVVSGAVAGRKGSVIGPSSGNQNENDFKNIQIKNVHIKYEAGKKTTGEIMVYLPNCYFVHIQDCSFIDMGGLTTQLLCCWSTYLLSGGIELKSMCEHLLIENCYFEGGHKGYCSWGTSTGPDKGGNRAYTTLFNNKFKNISELAIDCYHSDSVQIKDNLIASSVRGIFIDGYQGKVEGNIITHKWIEEDPNTFLYAPEIGIYNEESYNCITSNNIIRDCTRAAILCGGGTCGCNFSNNTFCYNYCAFEFNEAFTSNKYNSVYNLISNNRIDACYGPVFNVIADHGGWDIVNNFINIWGLNNEDAQPLFYLQTSLWASISNNKFANSTNAYTGQYNTAGNVSTLIKSKDNTCRFSGIFKDNEVNATMSYLFDFAVASDLFIMNNLFKKPLEAPYQIQYLSYAVKYVFSNNRWSNAYDTWTDSQGGSGNQPSSI